MRVNVLHLHLGHAPFRLTYTTGSAICNTAGNRLGGFRFLTCIQLSSSRIEVSHRSLITLKTILPVTNFIASLERKRRERDGGGGCLTNDGRERGSEAWS